MQCACVWVGVDITERKKKDGKGEKNIMRPGARAQWRGWGVVGK